MTQQITEAQSIAALAQEPKKGDDAAFKYAFVPNGPGEYRIESLEEFQETPNRKTGTTELHEVDSFITFSKRHGSLSNAVIYIDADYENNKVSATTVFDDHGEDTPGWRKHRATFNPRQTKPWKQWFAKNGQAMSQEELGMFFEHNLSDFAAIEGKPTGAMVLAFVISLQETRTVRYGSATNLQNGMVQLEYTEEGDKAQKGKLEIFKEFSLGIAPFIGGKPYQIDAFLRYRIDRGTGQIKFWYELKQPEKVLESACSDLIQKIKDDTGLPVVFGKP